MKIRASLLAFSAAVVLLSLPLLGQDRRPQSQPRGTPTGQTNRGTPAVQSRAPVQPQPSGSYSTGSRTMRGNPAIGGASAYRVSPSNPVAYRAPDLKGTSFVSLGNYYRWQDFLYYLRSRYLFDSYYLSRFYRNREPLLTPMLMKLTLRQPLTLSEQMLSTVDELQALVTALQSGKPVDHDLIKSKTQEIRDLAKQIRKDQSLEFIDQRKDRNVLDGIDTGKLGLEAVNRLREMTLDLNTQLKNMYRQRATSTISVDYLTQPSFESLSKGIDKLAKEVESSARKVKIG